MALAGSAWRMIAIDQGGGKRRAAKINRLGFVI